MRNYSALFTIAFCLSLFGSCIKEDGFTDTKLSYSLKATNLSASLKSNATESGLVVVPNTKGSINWSSASINLAQADFISLNDGATSTKTVENLFFKNALKDSISGVLNIKSGSYKNINFLIKIAESKTNTPILIRGNYIEESGTTIPVEVNLNISQSINLQSPDIEITMGSYLAKITVELNNLVKGLTASDFGQTTRTGANNAIIINTETNKLLFAKLLLNLRSCISIDISKQ